MCAVSRECSNDPKGYQSCEMSSLSRMMINPNILCDQVICNIYDNNDNRWLKYNKQILNECSALGLYSEYETYSCNSKINESVCQNYLRELSQHGGGDKLANFKQCDMICHDLDTCKDEAYCNGYVYGVFCDFFGKLIYLPPKSICNGKSECDNKIDEFHCTLSRPLNLDASEFCVKEQIEQFDRLPVPVVNFTRCGPIQQDSSWNKYFSYCSDFSDQYNCSDPERGVLRCEVNGFPSTVSFGILCLDTVELCDDGIDKICEQVSETCLVHKHLLCDGVVDCMDASDESNAQCNALFEKKCNRR